MQTPKTAASENPAHTYSHFGPKIKPQSWANSGTSLSTPVEKVYLCDMRILVIGIQSCSYA